MSGYVSEWVQSKRDSFNPGRWRLGTGMASFELIAAVLSRVTRFFTKQVERCSFSADATRFTDRTA